MARGVRRTLEEGEAVRYLEGVLAVDRALPLDAVRGRAREGSRGAVLARDLVALRRLFRRSRLRTTALPVALTVGSRHAAVTGFVCAGARVSGYRDSTLRQLAGLGAVRFGFGLSARAWQLTALRRTEVTEPIPDAGIGVYVRGSSVARTTVAVEWDSGSATTTVLLEKVRAYRQVAPLQLWAVATVSRGDRIARCLEAVLGMEASGVVAVDWRDGRLLAVVSMGAALRAALASAIPVGAPWRDAVLDDAEGSACAVVGAGLGGGHR